MLPIQLGPNVLSGKWRGAGRIGRFRGLDIDPDLAEDWVASTVGRATPPHLGLSVLPDGRLLRDAVAQDTAGWLGARRAAASGTDVGFLLKLLDAGERLPLHVHPGRGFMRRVAGPQQRHGKSESWVVLDAEPGASVRFGFNRDVEAAELAGWVGEQDVDALVGCTTVVEVHPGDTVFCPAGVPHSIGEGLFVVEVEEPTDLSIMLEWDGFAVDGPRDGHLGLGFPLALEAVDRSAWPRRRVEACIVRGGGQRETGAGVRPALVQMARSFFAVESVSAPAHWAAAFCVVVAVRGSGVLETGGGSTAVTAGQTFVVPFSAGDCAVRGDVELIRASATADGEVNDLRLVGEHAGGRDS